MILFPVVRHTDENSPGFYRENAKAVNLEKYPGVFLEN
jgi:hypothetical protein